MAIKTREKTDNEIKQVVKALDLYQIAHPQAEIEVYRQSPVSIRIRIVDRDFRGIGRADRHDRVWRLFEGLSEEVQSQISLLLLLTPEESSKSFANIEFDNPIPAAS